MSDDDAGERGAPPAGPGQAPPVPGVAPRVAVPKFTPPPHPRRPATTAVPGSSRPSFSTEYADHRPPDQPTVPAPAGDAERSGVIGVPEGIDDDDSGRFSTGQIGLEDIEPIENDVTDEAPTGTFRSLPPAPPSAAVVLGVMPPSRTPVPFERRGAAGAAVERGGAAADAEQAARLELRRRTIAARSQRGGPPGGEGDVEEDTRIEEPPPLAEPIGEHASASGPEVPVAQAGDPEAGDPEAGDAEAGDAEVGAVETPRPEVAIVGAPRVADEMAVSTDAPPAAPVASAPASPRAGRHAVAHLSVPAPVLPARTGPSFGRVLVIVGATVVVAGAVVLGLLRDDVAQFIADAGLGPGATEVAPREPRGPESVPIEERAPPIVAPPPAVVGPAEPEAAPPAEPEVAPPPEPVIEAGAEVGESTTSAEAAPEVAAEPEVAPPAEPETAPPSDAEVAEGPGAELLASAQALVESKPAEALELARRSYEAEAGNPALETMAMAACNVPDGEAARWAHRRIKANQFARRRLIDYCLHERGVELLWSGEGPTPKELVIRAQRLFEAGDYAAADEAARRSYAVKRSNEAVSLIGRCACRLGDAAQADRTRKMVPAAVRAAIESECAAAGITF